jgi:hypothetical protein
MADARDLVSGLVPPKPGDSDGHYRWQWAVFLKIWALIVFVIWSIGGLAGLGLDGFARASDVANLQQEVRDARVTALGAQMFDLRIKQCQNTGPLRQVLAEQLVRLNREYREITGDWYELQPCSDLQ